MLLTDIPTEVLTNILDHLACSKVFNPRREDEFWYTRWYVPDYQALYSVCLTSRRLRDIGQRVLYRSFKPGYGHGRMFRNFTWKGRLIMFLRTLLLRPDLAALVRTCFISARLVAHVGEEEAEEALRDAARIRGVDLSEFLQPFRASKWCRQPMRDGVLVMLLACLPNLSGLYLSGELDKYGYRMRWFNIFGPSLKAAGVSSLRLQTLYLDSVGVGLDRGPGQTQSPCVAGLLEMASSTLENLYTFACDIKLDSLAKPLPKLRNVAIKTCDMDFTPLLSFSEGLESFAYHGGEFKCHAVL